MQKNAAIYVRVSTQEQSKHGLSVDNQIQALTEYCNNNNYNIVNIYNDAGISARKKYKNRPALMQLINDCKLGKIDIILFTKLDRWFRSVSNYYEVQDILDECKVPWRAIWEDYETETSSGVFKVNIMLSVAQAEADRTSERTKDAVAYRRKNGDFLGGRTPAGYKRENKKLIFDENRYDAVKALFDTYLTTFSPSKAHIAAARLGFNIPVTQVCRMLKNKAYAGDAHGSKCPAYITEEQYNLIMHASTKRNRTPKRSDRVYLFSGLCTCGYCGGHMVARVYFWKAKKTNTQRWYHLYSCSAHNDRRICNCPGVNIAEKKLEAYLLNNIGNIIKEQAKDYKFSDKDKNNYKKAIEVLKQRLKRIGDRYELGDINFVEYKNKNIAIKKEIAEIEAKLSNVRTLPALPDNWKNIYAELEPDAKRTWWLSILSEIVVTKEDIKVIFNTSLS